MKPDENQPKQDLREIYDLESATEIVSTIFNNADAAEPEAFIRALLPLYGNSTDAATTDALRCLMRAAYNKSVDADNSFDLYLQFLQSPESSSPKVASGAKASLSPYIDAMAELFNTAKGVIERNDPEELRAFKIAVRSIHHEIKAPESSPRPARVAEPSAERQRNVMELGEHLAAILENPETPVAIHNDIADAMNDLINDASPGIIADARRNWPAIAEFLLSQPQGEGGERQ